MSGALSSGVGPRPGADPGAGAPAPAACRDRKRDVRGRMRARLAAVCAREAERCGERVRGHLLALPEYAGALAIGCYIAIAGEVATDGLMREAMGRGRRVCVPAWDAARRAYGLVELGPRTACAAGPLGIPQPASGRNVAVGELDAILVPGLAFDRHGGRLGRGGGHYDRMLAGGSGRGPVRIALAFAWQVLDEVPCEAHDGRMDIVVTDEGVIRCGGRSAAEAKGGVSC